jgi:hypothetical protein
MLYGLGLTEAHAAPTLRRIHCFPEKRTDFQPFADICRRMSRVDTSSILDSGRSYGWLGRCTLVASELYAPL